MVRRLAAALCVAVLVAGVAFAAPEPAPCKRFEALLQKTDTPPPRSDDRGIDILSYDLDLKLDPAPGPTAGVVALTGRVDIGLVALHAGVDTLVLDLVPQFTCDGITRAGQLLAFTRTGEELHIAVPGGLATAAPETVTIAWHGRPPRHGNLYVGMMYRSDDAGTPGDPADDVPLMFTVSEPWSAHAWWPCKDHPADKAQVSLAATVPADLSVVGNGSLETVTDAEPGWRRFAWRERYPLPTYLVSVAASRYAPWTEECRPMGADAVPLEFHALEPDVPAARELFAETCAMMDLLTSRLGPYPFAGEKYAQVEVIWGGAMEHTTATSLGQFMLTGDRRYENVVIHEMAHQWFGDSLTPSRWSDIWLNEGFATYAEALWLEHSEGAQAYHDFLQLVGPQRHPDRFAGAGTLSNPSPILPNTLVYDKGAWVLHMLRQVIGDDAFFRFLRDYAADPALAQGSVDTADMIARAQVAAGRDLGAFFTPWLDTDEVPVLSLEVVRRRAAAPGSATIRLRQHQPTPLTVPVPLVIRSGTELIHVTAVLDARSQDFTYDLAGRMDDVAADTDRPTLARWLATTPPALTVRGPAPNPVGAAGADFTIFLTDDSQLFVKIYDSRGALLADLDAGALVATGPADDPAATGAPWHWAPADAPTHLPSGCYWFEFRAGNHRRAVPLTLVR